jgi:hypothetical protein
MKKHVNEAKRMANEKLDEFPQKPSSLTAEKTDKKKKNAI